MSRKETHVTNKNGWNTLNAMHFDILYTLYRQYVVGITNQHRLSMTCRETIKTYNCCVYAECEG